MIEPLTILHIMNHYQLLEGHRGSSIDGNIKVWCPFHEDNNPSLNIDLSRGVYMCFGCGVKGYILDFVAQLEGVNQLQALEFIAAINKNNGIKSDSRVQFVDRKKKEKEELLDDAQIFFESLPRPSWSYITHSYLHERGFTSEFLSEYDVRINQSSNYPVIIPMREQKQFVGYVCRRVNNKEPKYLYNRGFSRKEALVGNLEEGPVLVTEGILDLMKALQFGFTNSCAILGWKITDEQVDKISQFTDTILCGLDNTSTGEKGFEILCRNFKRVVRLQFPESTKDIGDLNIYQFRKMLLDIEKEVGGWKLNKPSYN